jgi:thioredoxin-like negative regulator of GroEL
MGLDDLTDILFFYDADQQVKDFFAIRGVPAIYLYNQHGKLIQLHRGATALTKIRSELQKSISSR